MIHIAYVWNLHNGTNELIYKTEIENVENKPMGIGGGREMAWRWGKLYWDTAAAAAKSLQSCPTLCDPICGSPPGSPVPGILQARTLEWVAIAFSNAGK